MFCKGTRIFISCMKSYLSDVILETKLPELGNFIKQHVKPQQFRSHIPRPFLQKHFHTLGHRIFHSHSAYLKDSCCHSFARNSLRMIDYKYWRHLGEQTCGQRCRRKPCNGRFAVSTNTFTVYIIGRTTWENVYFHVSSVIACMCKCISVFR